MKKSKILQIVSPIILMTFIISGMITLAIYFRPLYYIDIKLLDIPEISGMSEQDIRTNYDALIDYYSIFNKEDLSLPTLKMSTEGKIHFEEVRVLFFAVVYTFLISIPLTTLVIYKNRNQKIHRYLKHTAIATIVVPTILGTLIALNWSRVFVIFHKLFFRNDYWIFDPLKDPVINMLPDLFFMHCALFVLCGVILSSLICYLIYKKSIRKTRVFLSTLI